MNKIYEAFHANKLHFYLFLLVYTEVIITICIGVFASVFTAGIPAPGSPGVITHLSPLGYGIEFGIYAVGIILFLTPLITLTIQAIKNDIKIKQILRMWFCAFGGCILAVFLFANDWSITGASAESLFDSLCIQLDLYVTEYAPLM